MKKHRSRSSEVGNREKGKDPAGLHWPTSMAVHATWRVVCESTFMMGGCSGGVVAVALGDLPSLMTCGARQPLTAQ